MNVQEMSWFQSVDAFEATTRPRNTEKGEQVVDAKQVWRCVNHSGGKDGLYLGTEQKPIGAIVLNPGVVKRANAHTIPRKDDSPALTVPDSYSKLPFKRVEHSFLMIFVQVWNQLGIAVGGKAMPFRFKLLLDFGIVKEFTIKNSGDGPVFIEDGLLAICQANDAQSAVGEGKAWNLQIAILIGAAMKYGLRHVSNDIW